VDLPDGLTEEEIIKTAKIEAESDAIGNATELLLTAIATFQCEPGCKIDDYDIKTEITKKGYVWDIRNFGVLKTFKTRAKAKVKTTLTCVPE